MPVVCLCWCSSTLAHVLCDDVNGLLRHHGVELHQLVVAEFLHNLSLLQEGFGGHGTGLQSLHRHLGGAVPRSWHRRTQAGISIGATSIHIQVTSFRSQTCRPCRLTWGEGQRPRGRALLRNDNVVNMQHRIRSGDSMRIRSYVILMHSWRII